MIDIAAEIVSYKSIAGLQVGENLSVYFNEMYISHVVEDTPYALPGGKRMLGYFVDEIISITAEMNGVIVSIGCNERYRGKHKSGVYAGIKMQEILQLTNKQRILNGSLVVDGDYGLLLTLPSPYDEIADYLKDIPLDLEFNEIYVTDYSFWAPKK